MQNTNNANQKYKRNNRHPVTTDMKIEQCIKTAAGKYGENAKQRQDVTRIT